MVEALDSPRITEGLAVWRRWLSSTIESEHTDTLIGAAVARRIEKTHRRLVVDGRTIGPETPAERLHDLRKDAKKLRYLGECFASLLPSTPRKQFVAPLKALQDVLGEHQDAAVHADDLRSLAAELPAEVASTEVLLALGHLVGRLVERQLMARAAFAARFAAFDLRATDEALGAIVASLRR